ncbi:hypothetical protein GCM10009747_24800 [Agromyces humatus]|uniref:Uncharacterized protein n=1 Tax=Agromyces humatus TaxID=279573 RepID=A0ABN2KTB7_9MICO
MGDDVVVQHPRALFADRAQRELGLPGHAELAHDQHVERGTERDRDRRGNRDASSGESEHDRIGRIDVDQAGGETPACVSPVGEVVHELTGRRVRDHPVIPCSHAAHSTASLQTDARVIVRDTGFVNPLSRSQEGAYGRIHEHAARAATGRMQSGRMPSTERLRDG